MADYEIRTERRVKDKIRAFNRQRGGLSIVFILFIGLLVFSPVDEAEALPVRLSVFCSAVFLFCGAVFVLTLRDALVLFAAATGVPAVLICLHQIRFAWFLAILLTNVGAVLIAGIAGRAVTRSFASELAEFDRLRAEAETDGLTCLLNRKGLKQAAETAWALCKRERKKASVLLVDIDYFKSYNDTLGHPEGDNILRQVAGRIRSCFRRETDIIGRIGGDEFLIFLSDADDRRVMEMAQSLSASILDLKVKTVSENNPGDFLSVSIGVVTSVPQPDHLLCDLYKVVDKALYCAKRSGRNRIFFCDGMIQPASPAEAAFPTGAAPAGAAGTEAESR